MPIDVILYALSENLIYLLEFEVSKRILSFALRRELAMGDARTSLIVLPLLLVLFQELFKMFVVEAEPSLGSLNGDSTCRGLHEDSGEVLWLGRALPWPVLLI